VKENVNSVVHQVQEKRSRGGRKPLGWSYLERLCFSPQQEDDLPFARTQDWGVNRTAEDRAIFHALTDVVAANPCNVSLLRKAGLKIPSSIGNALRYPNFVPGWPIERKVDMTTSNQDEIDGEEVFDIICNIQDPEHPLTLE
jgi:hypothetical protein